MPSSLGTFIDDIVWPMGGQCNTGFWLLWILILIRCCLRIMPKMIIKFNILTCLSIHNIQLIHIGEHGIWYLKLQITILFPLCCHVWCCQTLFLFFHIWCIMFLQNLASTIYLSILITKLISTCADILLLIFNESGSKNLQWKQSAE